MKWPMFYAVSTLNLNKRLVTSLCLEVEATITPCRSKSKHFWFAICHLSGLRFVYISGREVTCDPLLAGNLYFEFGKFQYLRI